MSNGGDRVQKTWLPIVDTTALQLIVEGEQPFSVIVTYGVGDIQQVQSLYDGLINFVAVDVPVAAMVEVDG
jgi:hypothetical protein